MRRAEPRTVTQAAEDICACQSHDRVIKVCIGTMAGRGVRNRAPRPREAANPRRRTNGGRVFGLWLSGTKIENLLFCFFWMPKFGNYPHTESPFVTNTSTSVLADDVDNVRTRSAVLLGQARAVDVSARHQRQDRREHWGRHLLPHKRQLGVASPLHAWRNGHRRDRLCAAAPGPR